MNLFLLVSIALSCFFAIPAFAQSYPLGYPPGTFEGYGQQLSTPPQPLSPGSLIPGRLILGIAGAIALLWAAWATLFLLSVFKKMKHIPREKILANAWKLTLQHRKLVILFFLAQFILSLAPVLFQWFLSGTLGIKNVFLFQGIGFVFQALNFLASLWIMHALIALFDGKVFTRFEFSLTRQQIFSFLAASALATLASILGFFLLIVPGIIVAISLSFFPLFILEKNERPIQAIRSSIALTRGRRFEIFLMYLLLTAINLAGASAFFVGLLITMPFAAFAWIGMARELEATRIR